MQNSCINNGVSNGLKEKKEKNMQKVSYDKSKRREEETGGERLIGANTKNIPYLSTVATQYKTRQRGVRRLLMRVTVRKRVLMMGKARRHAGTQVCKPRINDG